MYQIFCHELEDMGNSLLLFCFFFSSFLLPVCSLSLSRFYMTLLMADILRLSLGKRLNLIQRPGTPH